MGRWANPCLLATLVSKLGFAQTETRADGQVQVRFYTGYGLKVRERRAIAPPDPESVNGAFDPAGAQELNGYSLTVAHANGVAQNGQNGASNGFHAGAEKRNGASNGFHTDKHNGASNGFQGNGFHANGFKGEPLEENGLVPAWELASLQPNGAPRRETISEPGVDSIHLVPGSVRQDLSALALATSSYEPGRVPDYGPASAQSGAGEPPPNAACPSEAGRLPDAPGPAESDASSIESGLGSGFDSAFAPGLESALGSGLGLPLGSSFAAALRSELDESNRPVGPNRHAALSGKVIGVVGFPAERAVALGQSLAAQHCSFVLLTQAEAEFKQGAANSCHLLWVAAAQDWSNPASLKVNWLTKLKRPVLVESDRTTLSFLARFPQSGPREFVPGPCATEELMWRSALILGRLPAPKSRKKGKRNHPKLVIADNDPAALTLVESVLTQEGVECQVADQGLLALELIKATRPDAVILEVTLPGADGFQLLAEIRRDPALAQMVVILLTSQQAEADVLRGFSLGADDYVTKPFSPLELAARLKRALARQS